MTEESSKEYNHNEIKDYITSLIKRKYSCVPLTIKYLGGGSYGMAYKIQMDIPPYFMVIKVYRVDDLHRIEANDLITLSKNTSIKIPNVYFIHDSDSNIPINCLAMEWIDGINAASKIRFLFVSKKKKKRFADIITNSMIEFHNCHNDKFGNIKNPQYDNWLDYYKPFAKSILDKTCQLVKENKIKKIVLKIMEQAYTMFDLIFEEEIKEAVLTHGDLNVMNIMVNPNSFEPIAIIDPLESKYADREFDLFQLNNLTGRYYGLYKTYKEKYQVSKNCDIKCAFYALWNEVYCYIKSGKLFVSIMKPLVKNMNRELKKFKERRKK